MADFEASSGSDISPLDAPLSVPNPRPPPKQQQQQQQQGSVNQKAAPPITLSQLTGGKASSDSSAGSPNANASNVNAQRQGQIASPAVNLGGGGGVNAAAAAASSSADSVLAAASDPKANPALAAALAAANRRMPIKSNLGLGSSSSSPAPSPTPASSMSLSPTLAVSGGVSSVVPAAVSAPPMVAAPSLSAPPPPSAATPETLSRAQIASKPPTASTVSLSGAPPLNLGGGIAASSADSVLAAASDPKANPALAAALAAANRRMPIKSNLGLGSPPTPAPSSALTSPASPLTYAAAQAANNTSNHSAGEQQRQQTQPTPAAAAAKENKTVEDSRSSSPAAGIHHVSSAMPSASRENAQNNSVTTKRDNDREGDREAEERREADRLSLFEKDLTAGSRITPAKEIARGDDAALYRHGIRESKPPMEVARRDGVSSSSPTTRGGGGGGGVSKKNSTTNDDEAMAPNHNYDGTYYNVNPRGDLRNRFEEQVRQREAFLAKKAEMEEKLLAEKLARRRRNYDPNRFYNVECRPTSPSSPPPPPRSTPQQKFEAELAAFKKRRDMADEAKEMARLQKIEERLRRRRKSGTSSASALLIGGGGAGAGGDTSTCIVDQQGRNKSSNRRGGEVSGGTSSFRRSKFLVTASLADPDSVPYDLFRFGTKNGISSNHSHHTDATTIGASDMSIRRANVGSLVRTGRLATSKKGASLSQIAGGVGAGSGDDGVGIAPPTNISYATFTKVASVGKTHLGQGGALSPSTSAPAVLFGGFFKLEPTEAEAREEIEKKRQAAQPSFITNAATQNEYANLTEEQNRKRVDRALEKKRREKEKELLRRRRDEERESAHRRRFERKKKRMAQRMSERSYVVQNPDGSVSAHIEAAPLPVKVLRSGSTSGMSDDEEDIDGSGSDYSSRSFSSNRGNSDAASSTSTSSSSSSSDGYGSSSSSSSFSEKKADKKEKRAQKKAAFNELPLRHQLARVGCFSDGFYCFDEESKGWTRLNERIRVEPTTRRSTVVGHTATATNSSSIRTITESGRGLRKSSFPAPRGHHAAAFSQIDNTLYFHGGVGGPAPQALSNRNLENYLKLRERALAVMSSSGKTTRRGGGVNEDGNKFTSKFAVSVDLYDENTVADVISPPADLEEALDRMGHLCDLWGLNMEKLVLKRIPYGFDEASLEWALRRREEEDREEEAAGSRRHKPDDKNNNGNSGSPLAQRRAQTDKILADIAAERHLLLKRSHRSGHVGVVLPSSGGFVVIGGQYAHATKAKISRKRDAKLFSSSVSKNTTLQSPSNTHQQQPSGFAVEDDSETTENSDSGSGASSVSSVTARRRERRRQERAIREESKKQQEHQQQQQQHEQSYALGSGHHIVGGNYNAAGEHRRYSAEDDVVGDGPNEADDDDTSPADRSKWRVEYGLCSLRTLDVFNVNSRPLQPPPPPSRGKDGRESSAAVHNADDVCSWRLLPTTGAVPCPRMGHAVVVAPVCETITTVFRDAPKSEEELLEEHAEHQSPNHRANYQNGSQAGMGSGSDNSFFLPPPLTRSIEAGAAMYLFGGQTTAEHYMRHEASMSTQNNNNYNASGSPHRGPHHHWDQNHNTGGHTGSSAVSSPPSCATDITSRLLFPLEDLYQLNLATFVWSKVDLQPSLLFGGGLRTPFPSSSSAASPSAGGNFWGANSVFKMVSNNTNSASGARNVTSCSNDTRSATAPFALKLNANRRVLLNPHLSVVEVPSLCQNNTDASPLFDAPHQSRDDEEATTVASPMNHNEGINLLMMPAPTSANRMINQHESYSSSDAKGGLFVVKDTVPRGGLETQQQLQQHKQQGSAAGVGVPFSHPYGTQKSFTVALGVEGFGALQLLSGPPEHHQQSIALTQQQQQQQHLPTNTNVASFTGSPLLARPQQSIVVTSAATSRDLRVQQVKHYHQPAPAKIYALVLTGLITTAGATTTAHCLYKIENGPFESLRHQRARRREERKLWAREKEAERRKEKGEGIHGRGRGGLGRQYNDGDNEETSHSYYDSPPRPNHRTNDACVEPSGLVNDSTSAVTLAKEQQGASSPRRKRQKKTNASRNQKIKRSASSSGSHGYAEDNSDSRKTGTSSSEDNTERRENATTDRSKAVTFGNSDKAVGATSPQRTADDGRPPADRKIVDGEKVVRKLLEMARNGQKRGKDGEGQPADVYITIRDEDKALRDEQRRKSQKYGGAPSFLSYRSTPSDVKKRKEEVRRRKESNGGNSSTAGLAMSAGGGGGGTRRNTMVRPNSSSFKASQTVSYVSASTPLALRGGVPHARNRSASPLAGRLSTRRKHSKSSSYSVSTGLHKSHHAVDWVAWLHGETTKKGQSVPEGVQVSLEMVSLVPMRALGLSFTSAVGALGACSPFADEVMGFSQSHDENGSSPTTNSMRGRKDGSSGGGGGGPSPHLLHQSAAIAPKFANFSLALTGIELDVRRGPFDPSVRMSNKRSIALTSTHPPTHITEGGGGGAAPACCEFMGPLFMSEAYIGRRLREAERREAQRRFEAEVAASSTSPAPTASPQPADSRSTNKDRKEIGNKKLRGSKKSRGSSAGSSSANYGEDFEKKSSSTRSYSNSFSSSRSRTPSNYSSGYSSRSSSSPRRKQKKKMNAKQHQKEREDEKRTPAKRKESPPTKQNPPQNIASPTSPHKHHQRQQAPPSQHSTTDRKADTLPLVFEEMPPSSPSWWQASQPYNALMAHYQHHFSRALPTYVAEQHAALQAADIEERAILVHQSKQGAQPYVSASYRDQTQHSSPRAAPNGHAYDPNQPQPSAYYSPHNPHGHHLNPTTSATYPPTHQSQPHPLYYANEYPPYSSFSDYNNNSSAATRGLLPPNYNMYNAPPSPPAHTSPPHNYDNNNPQHNLYQQQQQQQYYPHPHPHHPMPMSSAAGPYVNNYNNNYMYYNDGTSNPNFIVGASTNYPAHWHDSNPHQLYQQHQHQQQQPLPYPQQRNHQSAYSVNSAYSQQPKPHPQPIVIEDPDEEKAEGRGTTRGGRRGIILDPCHPLVALHFHLAYSYAWKPIPVAGNAGLVLSSQDKKKLHRYKKLFLDAAAVIASGETSAGGGGGGANTAIGSRSGILGTKGSRSSSLLRVSSESSVVVNRPQSSAANTNTVVEASAGKATSKSAALAAAAAALPSGCSGKGYNAYYSEYYFRAQRAAQMRALGKLRGLLPVWDGFAFVEGGPLVRIHEVRPSLRQWPQHLEEHQHHHDPPKWTFVLVGGSAAADVAKSCAYSNKLKSKQIGERLKASCPAHKRPSDLKHHRLLVQTLREAGAGGGCWPDSLDLLVPAKTTNDGKRKKNGSSSRGGAAAAAGIFVQHPPALLLFLKRNPALYPVAMSAGQVLTSEKAAADRRREQLITRLIGRGREQALGVEGSQFYPNHTVVVVGDSGSGVVMPMPPPSVYGGSSRRGNKDGKGEEKGGHINLWRASASAVVPSNALPCPPAVSLLGARPPSAQQMKSSTTGNLSNGMYSPPAAATTAVSYEEEYEVDESRPNPSGFRRNRFSAPIDRFVRPSTAPGAAREYLAQRQQHETLQMGGNSASPPPKPKSGFEITKMVDRLNRQPQRRGADEEAAKDPKNKKQKRSASALDIEKQVNRLYTQDVAVRARHQAERERAKNKEIETMIHRTAKPYAEVYGGGSKEEAPWHPNSLHKYYPEQEQQPSVTATTTYTYGSESSPHQSSSALKDSTNGGGYQAVQFAPL